MGMEAAAAKEAAAGKVVSVASHITRGVGIVVEATEEEGELEEHSAIDWSLLPPREDPEVQLDDYAPLVSMLDKSDAAEPTPRPVSPVRHQLEAQPAVVLGSLGGESAYEAAAFGSPQLEANVEDEDDRAPSPMMIETEPLAGLPSDVAPPKAVLAFADKAVPDPTVTRAPKPELPRMVPRGHAPPKFDSKQRILALAESAEAAAEAAAAEVAGWHPVPLHPLAHAGVNSTRTLQVEREALAAKTFESEVTPAKVGAEIRQARRDATHHLNTPGSAQVRYGALTKLEPAAAERATESRGRKERQAMWHAKRQALCPTLDELFTREREPEFIDTQADAQLVPLH